MADVLAAALFPESLDAEARAEVEAVLARDAGARRLYLRARALDAHLATELEKALPGRHALVRRALLDAGHADALTGAEREALAAEAPLLDAAFAAHPALATLAARIADEARAFEACWAGAPRPQPRRAADRPAQRRAPATRWAWRAGITLALTAFVAVAFLLVQRDASYTTIAVAEGQAQTVTLADGSRVKLMGGSRLRYSDPDKNAVFNRQVTLDGDAFFDVQPGAQRFTVHTADADVMVLGTRFAVQADARATEVTLVAGRVLLAPPGAPVRGVTLAPGQQSRVARGASVPTPPTAVVPARVLGWTGLFFFDQTRLADAAAQLADAFGVAVAVAPALEAEAVTGTFDREQGLAEIVGALATTLGVRAVQTEAGWRIG